MYGLAVGAAMIAVGLGGRVNMSSAAGEKAKAGTHAEYPLDSLTGLRAVNAKADIAMHQGRRALHLLQSLGGATLDASGESMAILTGVEFKDGTIEVDIAGQPQAGATPDIRGFIGIAFRVRDKGERFECFYLRMTNGRADEQLRRNHSVQYISAPDFPWQRLRKENPGEYESYVDLEPGAWTKMKIAVAGTKARLYVNGAEQPCLVVNDLKLGETSGQVAVWIGDQTEGYFSNLRMN